MGGITQVVPHPVCAGSRGIDDSPFAEARKHARQWRKRLTGREFPDGTQLVRKDRAQ